MLRCAHGYGFSWSEANIIKPKLLPTNIVQEHIEQPSPEQVREFVIAGHGDLVKVKQMLEEHPSLLNAAHPWNESDRETAIEAAAQMGNAEIANFLLERGAPLDICTAAMLGRRSVVESLLAERPEAIKSTGAHGIPLLTHASLSGNLELVQFLFNRGATNGTSSALHNAVSRGHLEIVKWLLENGNPDLGFKNFQGRTVLAVAMERSHQAIAQLLREHGAGE